MVRPVRVLLCPDKFRGTFTAAEVCAHLGRGLRQAPVPVEVSALPLADGGEGTLEVVASRRGGQRVSLTAPGPAGRPVRGEYLVAPDGTAWVESARFIGLELVAGLDWDPMRASSRGLGRAVADALDAGVARLVIGLGGSATVDGGAGMAVALGFRLLDADGRDVGPEPRYLPRVYAIDATTVHPTLPAAHITALCDVPNPMLGVEGAARVFGPQKGAAPETIGLLEEGLEALASAMGRLRGLPPGSLTSLAGGGAAGGLGTGCAAFLGARLVPGAEYLMEEAGYSALQASSDLVVTGEGSCDSQSRSGKVVAGVVRAARAAGKPVIVVAGEWDGTAPAGDRRVEVITGRDLDRGPGRLGPDGLETIGKWIGNGSPDGTAREQGIHGGESAEPRTGRESAIRGRKCFQVSDFGDSPNRNILLTGA